LGFGSEDGALTFLDVGRDKVWRRCLSTVTLAVFVAVLDYFPYCFQSFTMPSEGKGAVVDIQWDPRSTSYLLAAFASGLVSVLQDESPPIIYPLVHHCTGHVTLIDVDSRSDVQTFDKQPGGAI
jgi:hypothetical protein